MNDRQRSPTLGPPFQQEFENKQRLIPPECSVFHVWATNTRKMGLFVRDDPTCFAITMPTNGTFRFGKAADPAVQGRLRHLLPVGFVQMLLTLESSRIKIEMASKPFRRLLVRQKHDDRATVTVTERCLYVSQPTVPEFHLLNRI